MPTFHVTEGSPGPGSAQVSDAGVLRVALRGAFQVLRTSSYAGPALRWVRFENTGIGLREVEEPTAALVILCPPGWSGSMG